MKKTTLLIIAFLLSININAQQKFQSDIQSIKSIDGITTNRYKVKIDLTQPKPIGGDIGTVTITLTEQDMSLGFYIKYLKKTVNADGIIYWYTLLNSDREMFNILKYQKFQKPILGGKYNHCIILSKYDSDAALLYEHSYFCR